jgi:hypothetical protein
MKKMIIGVSTVITKICFNIFINCCKIMKEKQINYRALFCAGIIFLGSGAVFLISANSGVGAGLMILGCSFMTIGGKNKNKWNNKK